jgi:hypothetical protein
VGTELFNGKVRLCMEFKELQRPVKTFCFWCLHRQMEIFSKLFLQYENLIYILILERAIQNSGKCIQYIFDVFRNLMSVKFWKKMCLSQNLACS